MRKLNPDLQLEKQLSAQIYQALQGGVVENILKLCSTDTDSAYLRSNMEGNSLKIAKDLLPELWDLCEGVKKELSFTEPVDFYITGDSTVNAYSIAATKEGEAHIVNLNSSLVDLMTRDELRFVVGHELGHIINRDSKLTRLIYFIFPPENSVPPVTLQYKIRLHDQLAELVADRYGYLATKDLGVCVTAFFKMASGLDLGKMNVSMDALLKDNSRRLDYFLNDKGTSRSTHPVNPIRVEALHLFSTATTQKALDKGMDQLISILFKVGSSDIDSYMSMFIASAGIIVATADKNVSKEEYEMIIQHLSGLTIFPKAYLDDISQHDVSDIFNRSVKAILDIDPSMREAMFKYMIALVLSDKEISDEEIKFIFMIGDNLGYNEKEAAGIFAEMIQMNFVPSLDSIV